MKLRYRFFALLVAVIASPFFASAQTYLISTPIVVSCDGMLFDSGSELGTYNANENHTCSVFSASAGGMASFRFVQGQLGTGDIIRIYDGTTTASPMLGQYAGDQMLGRQFTASNTDGCLTVQFQSNADLSVGNFAMDLSCGGCRGVVPVISSAEGAVIHACIGEALSFSGANSIVPPGMSMSAYQWSFDDGITNSNQWPTATHTFYTGGVYYVSLTSTTVNSCLSSYTDYIRVEVAPHQYISVTSSPDSVCVGQAVNLGAAVTANVWTESIEGAGAQIVDSGSGTTSLTVSGYGATETITSVNDIAQIAINMEHSFMSDLVFTVTCPNGQSLILQQQSGGGVWFGIPVDVTTANTPGIGFDYAWSPTAVNPTMGTAAGTMVQSVTPKGGAAGNTLIPGVYASQNPWTSLVGCPFNGTWTILVQDVAGADDGYFFSWGVQFSEAAPFSVYQSFNVGFGTGCEGGSWSGPNIVNQATDCSTAIAQPSAGGMIDYTFSVVDNFGCTSQNGTTIEVYQPFDVQLVTIPSVNGNPGAAAVSVLGEGAPFFIQWSTGASGVNTVTGLAIGEYTVSVANSQGCVAQVPFEITVPQSLDETGVDFLKIGYSPVLNAVVVQNNEISQDWNYSIYNASGQLIYQKRGSRDARLEISTEGWASGMYLIAVQSSSGQLTKKLILN